MNTFDILDTTYQTVAVTFAGQPKRYHYKVPIAWGVALHDYLVVPANNTISVVRVEEIHRTPNFNGLPKLKYAIQRVDTTEFDALVKREQDFAYAMQEIEREKERNSIREALRTMVSGSSVGAALLESALSVVGNAPPVREETEAELRVPEAPKIDTGA